MKKEYVFGNAKVIVYSPLTQMTKEEQRSFFESEWKKGNPILKDIAQAAYDCLLDKSLEEKQA
ncbi:hypothetical protein [Niallia sp. 03091]|uniref:hypothetical protein n=1 Tax=unclassified Niallia TaxID=2837522 RepID=UPI004044D479